MNKSSSTPQCTRSPISLTHACARVHTHTHDCRVTPDTPLPFRWMICSLAFLELRRQPRHRVVFTLIFTKPYQIDRGVGTVRGQSLFAKPRGVLLPRNPPFAARPFGEACPRFGAERGAGGQEPRGGRLAARPWSHVRMARARRQAPAGAEAAESGGREAGRAPVPPAPSAQRSRLRLRKMILSPRCRLHLRTGGKKTHL